MKTRMLALATMAISLAPLATAQGPPSFDECGTLVDDLLGQCTVFAADSGGLYLPSQSLAGFQVGDRVRAVGDVTGSFGTICSGTFAGLLQNETWTLDPQCDVVSDPITVLCDPASDHHEGNFVKLDTSGFGSGVGSDLHLEAIDGPQDEFGFVLVSPDGSASLPIFNGVLCLGSPQGRYNAQIATNQGLPQLNSLGQFDASGVMQNISGTSSVGSGFDVPLELPFAPPGQLIQPGDVLYFQVWYRDEVVTPGDSANFSNMIEVLF